MEVQSVQRTPLLPHAVLPNPLTQEPPEQQPVQLPGPQLPLLVTHCAFWQILPVIVQFSQLYPEWPQSESVTPDIHMLYAVQHPVHVPFAQSPVVLPPPSAL